MVDIEGFEGILKYLGGYDGWFLWLSLDFLSMDER